MCARVCPTEVLCEQACVRNTQEDKPVEIGLLQRHATDAYFAQPGTPLFTRAAATGKRVAVVGAGPAGLSCAHRLAMLGHAVTLFDDKPKLGGLNEYGLATYKTVDDFAQKEIDWLLSIGGIEVQAEHSAGPRHAPGRPGAATSTPCSWAWAWPASTRLGIAEPADCAARATRWTSSPSCARRPTPAERAGGPARGGHRRRHDRGGRRRAEHAARRRGRDHGLPARARGHVGHRLRAAMGADPRRAHPATGARRSRCCERRRPRARRALRAHRAAGRPAGGRPTSTSTSRPTWCSPPSARRFEAQPLGVSA